MIKFNKEGIDKLQEKIDDNEFKNTYKIKQSDFTRNRKMSFKDIIYYIINKKGICTKMEINSYFEKVNSNKTISVQSLLNQKKLNPEVFISLNKII